MGRNLASLLTDSAARLPGRTAIKLDDAELTFAQLDGASAHLAGLLPEHGFKPGDRVGVMLPNVPYFPVVYYGILRAGGVVVPMNVLLKEREVAYYLGDSGAKLLFAWHDFGDDARPGAEAAGAELIDVVPGAFEQQVGAAAPVTHLHAVADDDTAVILYTSGTTGKPKGAELTHANLAGNALTKVETLIRLSEDDVILGALPLFHSFGQTAAMNAGILAGACLTLLPRFDAAKALGIMERDRVTVFLGVPTMYNGMLAVPQGERPDTSSLRTCISGGASLPVEVLRAFEGQFGTQILEGYGLSETSPVASFNHPDRERKPGSIGTPIRDVEMKVVDEQGADVPAGEVGEIVIRGPNVMKGYWQRPDATAEAMRGGWFHSGDLAKVDEDGYFFIVDRKKDLIIRGGYNVYPREVEEVLYEHPAVAEAAVVGIPDAQLGEEVGAAVALKAGADASCEELQGWVKERIAAYKYPRHVWLVPELPKGPTGKILKREIALPVREQT
ncbi:MAG TPA: long-chain fatty acid--CoA ligase [Conexibacter sp.]|jgi:long-chain acyl-CoA synthetase|nr:long-chain fatty acid--CoA ligase [Conexibacter sp.]